MIRLNKKTATTAVLAMVCIVATAQQAVRGTVKDSSGQPLIGVSVSVDGKPAAVTDAEGGFALKSASPQTKISFSYLGYESQTITIGRKTTIDIVMNDDTHALSEVVVVGYGTMKKVTSRVRCRVSVPRNSMRRVLPLYSRVCRARYLA